MAGLMRATGFLLVILTFLAAPVLARADETSAPTDDVTEAQALYRDAIKGLSEATELYREISDIYVDGGSTDGFELRLDRYASDTTERLQARNLRTVELSERVAAMSGSRKDVLDAMVQAIKVLDQVEHDSPAYLQDILDAAQSGDDAAFDALSQQTYMRAVAIMRTENALLDIQIASMKKRMPGVYWHRSSKAANEALALFHEAIAHGFGNEPMRVEETAVQMREQATAMRKLARGGLRARDRFVTASKLVGLFKKGAADLAVLFEEYDETFAIEREYADHIDDLADVLVEIEAGFEGADTVDDELIDNLNALTRELAMRRSIQAGKIFDGMMNIGRE